MDDHCKSLGIGETPLSWANWTKLTPHPQTLFFCIFPVLAKFVRGKDHLLSADYATTDGHSLTFLFVNRHRPLNVVQPAIIGQQEDTIHSAEFVVNANLNSDVVSASRKHRQGLRQWKDRVPNRSCGLFDIETGNLYNHESRRGAVTTVLHPMLHNRPIFSIDLGVRNEITLVCTWSDVKEDGTIYSDVSRYVISTLTRYTGTGVDHYLSLKLKEREDNDIQIHTQQLTRFHERTLDPKAYMEHIAAFKKHGIPILEANATESAMQARFHLANKKRSYWARLPNILLALADAKIEKISRQKGETGATLRNSTFGFPIVVIGKPTFASSRRGFRSVAPKKTIEFLSRFFPVVLIDEYNTSKVCATCCQNKLH